MPKAGATTRAAVKPEPEVKVVSISAIDAFELSGDLHGGFVFRTSESSFTLAMSCGDMYDFEVSAVKRVLAALEKLPITQDVHEAAELLRNR